ncbi:MAG TPA: hypothetical protein VK014_14620 [Cyclobacteriaceae bacterium]|nr:hypothetical protein [Cyclobacteriaceae bacterium]
MGKKRINIKKLKPAQRRTVKALGYFFFALLFLQIALYFGSDLLLRSYLQREVERVSKGKYAIDFDRFNLSILERGFYVQGFTLIPQEEAYQFHEGPLYKITIPKISVKGLGYNFAHDILTIEDIRFSKPGIQSRQDPNVLQKNEVTPLEVLEEEIRKSFGGGLKNIIINHLSIDEADLLLENFISQRSITADNTNLYVRHIELLTSEENAPPFNAQGFALDLQNFEIVLADSIHTVKSTSINVSSLDQYIRAEKVSIIPDLNRPAEDYYEIYLDNLELMEADIDRMFYTSDVDIGSLRLDRPVFTHYSETTPNSGTDSLQGLYPLIENILASISIQDLAISEGQYLHSSLQEPDRNRIEADGINFKMDRVYIGPDSLKVRDQFFYAQDAELDIAKVRVALADGVHWISGEKVFISSFEDRVTMERVEVKPVYEEEPPNMTLFEIEIPQVALDNTNLKKIYNENILDIDEMIISSPAVLLKDLSPNEELSGKTTLQELTRNYLKAIYVQRLEMVDGSLVLDNDLRVRQDSLSFGKVSFVLEDFRLDEQTEAESSSRIFLAQDLRLEVEDYALKLSDNLHLFTAQRILLDTKEQYVSIAGFRLRPQGGGNIKNVLNRYSQTTVFDIEVPDFYVYGIDISEAVFHGKLFVNEIKVPSPVIKLQIHSNPDAVNEDNRLDRLDVVNLLTSYFSVVKVDAVTIEEGTLELENYGGEKLQTFAENDVNIGIKNFYVDKYIDPLDTRVLFAEELDIHLNNYVFNIAEGKYRIVADGISFNSAREEINTTNVRLRPSRTLDAKAVIQADIPNMSVKGVDLEAFLFENTLALSKLKFTDAAVQLYLNREKAEELMVSRSQRRRERNLPKTIDIIRIDTVEAANAQVNLAYREEGQDRELINSGVNMSFYGFMLDSAKLTEGDLAAFFSSMAVEMDQFSLALKDSVHSINFSKVGFDSKSGEIAFDNLSIVPKDQTGKKGFPVIEATIPHVSLKTNSLTSLQSTGDFVVKQMMLSKPEITLYLDKEEADKLEEDEEKLAQKVIENLNIEDFEIKDGLLTLKEKGNPEKVSTFRNLSISLTDLHFDLASPSTLDRNFYLNKEFEFELTDYEIKLPDSLNVLRVGLALLSEDGLILRDVFLTPRYGDFEYHRMVGYQTDVAKVYIPEIIIEGLKVDKLMGEKALEAERVSVYQAQVDVFRDKRWKEDPDQYRPMPQELIAKALLDVRIDSLLIHNAEVVYREFPNKGFIPGELSFRQLEAVFTPFYMNKKSEAFPLSSSFINASAMINGSAPISLSGQMFFEAPYPIQLVAEVGEFELATLNSIIETNAFLKVLDGVVRESRWEFTLDENEARGTMALHYNDLKLMLLEERTLERGRGRKHVLTFVINNLAVRSNNPRKFFNRMVTSPIYYKRNKSKFVFNYLWKSTMTGLQGSVGLGKPKEEK